jgi:hypothetical protein
MDHNPSPLIITLADIADAKEGNPFTEVMDLVDDLLVDFDKGFVKDWLSVSANRSLRDLLATL